MIRQAQAGGGKSRRDPGNNAANTGNIALAITPPLR